jgi:hypothetical protein
MRRLKFAKFVLTKSYVGSSLQQLVNEKRKERRKARVDLKQQVDTHARMQDTMQYFTQNAYRPLVRGAEQDPAYLTEALRNAVARPFVFAGRPQFDVANRYTPQPVQPNMSARPVTYSYSMNDPARSFGH